jgi:hypothetical protein
MPIRAVRRTSEPPTACHAQPLDTVSTTHPSRTPSNLFAHPESPFEGERASTGVCGVRRGVRVGGMNVERWSHDSPSKSKPPDSTYRRTPIFTA